ncbi:hypothetical protein ARMGADRAFT_1063156 [Armillaria gallica]|uniref:Uncharacterized protein n=1 Tax=Armillaria gallica TaxID=47427 RepID=A0A2H3DFP4_ARMGA|nr:hypothetical protein ARMGADRAFT_1063156 [Armillaria gallica]
MQPQVVPPERHYFAFSIDVAATLELYCDGGDDSMLQKLDGVKDRMYAGYCLMVDGRVDEENKYHVIDIRPVQQGLTKPHPRNLSNYRGALPWDNCYHPTCYDVCARILTEWRDYSQSPCVVLSAPLVKAIPEDIRYDRLLRARVDDEQALRILDGQQDAPEIDLPDETDSQTCKTFLAKIPCSDNPEEDAIFVPVMRIDHVLSNVPEISDLTQLCGDLDLFQEIVQEYQLARYGSILFKPPEGPPIDDTPIPGNFLMVYSIMSTSSRTSTEGDPESDRSGSHGPDPSLLDS